MQFLADYYEIIKAFHIIAMVAWMAGMLYLPRLFVYHAGVAVGSESDALLQTMERRLLRFIMNPAMITVWVLGLTLAIISDAFSGGSGHWIHAKVTLVLVMTVIHGFLAVCRKKFAAGQNPHSAKFYRIINEVPTVLLIGIILLVVLKPF